MKILYLNETTIYVKILIFITIIRNVFGRVPDKMWMGFESDHRHQYRSEFSARHDQDAVDLYKEYKDSIYVSRWYNASFVCQIPIFTFTVPTRTRTGQANPTSYGYNVGLPFLHALFVLAGIALFSPIIFPEERRRSFRSHLNLHSINKFLETQMSLISESALGRSMKSREKRSLFFFLENNLKLAFEAVLNSIDQWLEYLPYFAKNKLQNCFQWSVCEMYNKPKKYGLIGLLFRGVFPYDHDLENESSNVISNYRLAAVYGNKRTNDCKHQYKGCSLNKWEVVREVINYVLSRSEHKVTKTQKNMILFLMDTIFSYRYGS